jgi:hypothetical protein
MPKFRRYRRYRHNGQEYILTDIRTVGVDIFIRLTPYSKFLEDRRIP